MLSAEIFTQSAKGSVKQCPLFPILSCGNKKDFKKYKDSEAPDQSEYLCNQI